MKVCKFCGKTLEREDAVCVYCGYDPKTDMMSPDFKPKKKKLERQIHETIIKKQTRDRSTGVDPRIKNFAFIGLAIVLFSIFYKYNFNIEGATSEISYFFSKLMRGKISFLKFGKNKNIEKIEWIDMKNFEGTKQKISKGDLLIEGIFFDSEGKSLVVINGQALSEGQYLNNITVKKIYRDSVEIIADGQQISLKVNEALP